ncbi:MAG: response regulator transcription factor [Anaerolineales bacterium]
MTSDSNDKQENTPAPEAGLRVLIADDHPVVRSGVRNELAVHADLQVVGEAVDGDEVLARVRELSPQVLVLDVHMPGMKAVEILHALADFPAPPATLILSAYGDPENVFGMLEAGARGYMLKDADPEQIAEGIRAVAAGKRWLSQEILEVVLTQRLPPVEVLPARYERLSEREREVLIFLGQGLNNAQIAERMQLSETTVKNHVTSLYDKLDLHSRAEAVAYAWQLGLMQN